MKNPIIVSLQSSTARIAVALVLGATVSGCWFDDEPEPVQNTSDMVVEVLPEEPTGPTIFYEMDEISFRDQFKEELNTLRDEDPGKAKNVIIGMAQIIAFKNLSENDLDYTSSVEIKNPFEDIDTDSDYFYSVFHRKMKDKFVNGVTFDSIIKLGYGHSRNASVVHENSMRKVISEIDNKIDEINERQSSINSVMGQVGIVLPKADVLDKRIYISMSIINGSEIPVEEIQLSLSSANQAMKNLPPKVMVDLGREVLPGERRVVEMKDIGAFNGEDRIEDIPIIASVISITTKNDVSITGKEYSSARNILENMKSEYTNKVYDIQRELSDYEAKFESEIN